MSNSLENYNGNDPELLRLRDEKVDEELERKKERIAQLEREVKERLRQLEEENRMKREERKD